SEGCGCGSRVPAVPGIYRRTQVRGRSRPGQGGLHGQRGGRQYPCLAGCVVHGSIGQRNTGAQAMSPILRATSLLIAVLMASGAAAQAPGESSAVAPACNRTCLIGTLHSYLDALRHKDKGLAPFARNVRYAENDVEMPFGEGLWGS